MTCNPSNIVILTVLGIGTKLGKESGSNMINSSIIAIIDNKTRVIFAILINLDRFRNNPNNPNNIPQVTRMRFQILKNNISVKTSIA